MRGIIHLEDLHRRPPWTRHALLDWIGEPPTSEAIFAAYPPPELIVVGGTQQDFERLRPWLNECEVLMRPETPEQARALLIAGECWQPEAPGAVEPPPPQPGGDWWPLEVGEATHPGELAAAIRELELRWEDKHYSLLDGSSRPLTPKSPDLARFPEYRLAMRGGRCRFDWIWQSAGQECAVAENAHEWPAGHAKKLYGYQNNEPVGGEISQDGQVCLSIYQFDALLSAAPFPWREIQPGLVALVWPPQDPIHSVFYLKNFDYDDDEDERGGPPALVMGPDPTYRYALALDRLVYRRDLNGDLAQLGGEQPEYALFDSRHQRICTRPGQLLGGNSQRLVVWEKGHLLAEDFQTGRRELFAYEKELIEWSFPVQGGSNLLLIRLEEELAFLRLI